MNISKDSHEREQNYADKHQTMKSLTGLYSDSYDGP